MDPIDRSIDRSTGKYREKCDEKIPVYSIARKKCTVPGLGDEFLPSTIDVKSELNHFAELTDGRLRRQPRKKASS